MGCSQSKQADDVAVGSSEQRSKFAPAVETTQLLKTVSAKAAAIISDVVPTPTMEDKPDEKVNGVDEEKIAFKERADPRKQILTFYSNIEDEETEEEKPEDLVASNPNLAEEDNKKTSVFTVWRPCSNDAIRKMVEGQGVGKGLDIKGKSAKAGVLSGFVPYLQIHEEADKSKVKTLERGGRTRIFFASREARDQVMEELGPLQNHILNAVQDAKRTMKRSVASVFAASRSTSKLAAKAARTSLETSVKSVSSTGSSIIGSVSDNLSSMRICSDAEDNDDGTHSGTFSTITKKATNGIVKTTSVATDAVASTAAKITSPMSQGIRKGTKLATESIDDLSHRAVEKIASPIGEGLRKGAAMTTSTASSVHQRASETMTDLSNNALSSARTSLEFATSATSLIAKPMHKSIKDINIKALGIGKGKDDDDEVAWALKRLLWDMDDPSIRPIDDYEDCFGIELPDRLLWQAFVVDSDISRPEDSKWYNARPSQPAFQDMNFIAITKSRKHRKKDPDSKDPLVVLWQTCTGKSEEDDPMDPRGLIMAYEESGRVLPVVSDFDCFTMGSKNVSYEKLPEEQLELLNWCITSIEEVLQSQNGSTNVTWTDRWLDVLKTNATKGFHPEIPKYGFGDAKSYSIVEEAVSFLQDSGAVRHGAECFNFYFPQQLDEEFLVVFDSFPDDKWRYMTVAELQVFLLDRIKEGFTFPLNPKWILTDDNIWKELYDHLLESNAPCVQESLDAWFPPEIRTRIGDIRKRYPKGFVCDIKRDEEDTEAMDLAMFNLDRQMIFQRARVKFFCVWSMIGLLEKVRKRRVLLEECEEGSEEESEEEGDDEGDGSPDAVVAQNVAITSSD